MRKGVGSLGVPHALAQWGGKESSISHRKKSTKRLPLGQHLKLGSIVLTAVFATLMACRQCAGVYRGGVKVKMSTEKFEPYGEPLPEFRSGNREHPRATSAILNAVGQYSFWFLVAVIV